MKNSEKLAIAQAFYKAAGEYVSTKTPGNLRSQVDEEYKAIYEQTGAKSFDVRIGDEKVGTYSIKVSKATEAETKKALRVTDPETFIAWGKNHWDICAEKFVLAHLEAYAQEYLLSTGEMPAGMHMIEVGTPAMPEQYAGGALKVDTQKVAEALGANLPDAMNNLLLGDGYDGQDE